jgi:F-type H+-transporting ATPase subunit gamma
MCGQLNEQITGHVLAALDDHPSPPDQRHALAVGLRAASRLEESGLAVEEVFEVPESAAEITDRADDLLVRLGDWQEARHVEEIHIFYCHHQSGASYEPTAHRLLPLDRRWLEELRHREWPTRRLPLITMDRDRLFSDLVAEYLFVSLHRAFAESLASEHASRLASMQGAERNIDERLHELTRRYNQRRQIAITEELLDINSGFEGLREPD